MYLCRLSQITSFLDLKPTIEFFHLSAKLTNLGIVLQTASWSHQHSPNGWWKVPDLHDWIPLPFQNILYTRIISLVFLANSYLYKLGDTCCMGRNDKRSNLPLWCGCRYEDKSRILYFYVYASVDNQQQMLNASSLLKRRMSELDLQ